MAHQISVVIPIYNAETTLTTCIDSFLAQTHENWELILVDDGSTDRSGEIARQYAAADTRIRYLRQENHGVSSARNRGIAEARGAYLFFCDSDDWVAPTALQTLYETAVAHRASVVLPRSVMHVYKSDGTLTENRYDPEGRFLLRDTTDLREHMASLFDCGSCFSTQGRLYDLAFLRRHAIRFCENSVVLEDLDFNLQCFRWTSHIARIEAVLYHFRVIDIAQYQNKRSDVAALTTSIAQVFRSFSQLAAEKELPFCQLYDDFITSYWIMAINHALRASRPARRSAVRAICREVKREQCYRRCDHGKVDTAYRVLFRTGSLFLFDTVTVLKQWKRRVTS